MKRLWILVGLLTGCAVEEAPEATSDATETFTVTAVRIGEDGAKQITQRSIPTAQRNALEPVEDDPCVAASVFLYDRADYQGNVLCISGTGTFALESFFHHWERVRDPLGWHYVRVGWQRQAMNAWATFFAADFYQDGNPNPVNSAGPQGGTNFYFWPSKLDQPYVVSPDSVVIY